MMWRARRRITWAPVASVIISTAALGHAADPPPAADAAKPAMGASKPEPDAFRAFLDGQNAFEHGDYLRAAERFEAAYRAAPHPDVLWNAARAWDRGGEIVRAANLYDRYLKEAPAGARDRDSAVAALQRIAPKVGRIEVITQGATEVTVDQQPLRGERIYVTPGAHVIAGIAGGRRLTKTASVGTGEAVSVALIEEPGPNAEKPAGPTVIVVPMTTPAPEPRPVLPGWRRVAVGAGLAATAVSGGLLIWSGVDTNASRSAFDREPTPQALEDGRAKQTRTNVLIATTAGLGVLTIGAAVILATAGKPSEPARAAVAIEIAGSSLSLRGRF
ncbi:MAG: tetratricopeptide repeat protein [Minicystis sp.]